MPHWLMLPLVVVIALGFTAKPQMQHVYLPIILNMAPPTNRGAAMPWQNQVCTDVTTLETAWWYNWTLDRRNCDAPGFVPMVWGKINKVPVLVDSGEWLLGFNEPNYTAQSNITPAEAVAMWPLLEATGRKLVSPAVGHCEWDIPGCVDDGWLEEFMALCDNCRIDRLAVHYYGCDPDKLFAYLDKRWTQYHKQMWLSEIACPSSLENPVPFMRKILPELSRHHVERYAWFATRTASWPEFAPLVAKNGVLTELGQVYSQQLR